MKGGGKVDGDRDSSLWLYAGWEEEVGAGAEEEERQSGELVGGWGDGKVRVPLGFADYQHFVRFFGDCFRAAIILQARAGSC